MGKSTALMLLVFIVLLIGFLGYISIQGQIIKPTCNKPYIIVGHSCCLDQNDNAICDSDEEPIESESQYEGDYQSQMDEESQQFQESQTCLTGWKCKTSNTKAYQNSDCSWQNLDFCDYGCSDGKCNSAPCYKGYLNEKICSVGWVEQKYQLEDCTVNWTKVEYCYYGCLDGQCNSEPQTSVITVSYVLDGDTIQLSTGERVRLIGINTPEVGEPCSAEATEKLKELVLGKEVTLESDVEDKDQYDRLLRYVYINGLFVNKEMVRLGLAHKYEYGSNTKYSALFEQAENEAKQNEGCIWKTPEENYFTDECIYIIKFNFDAAGNDNYNLNDEYVTFGNKCTYLIDMTGWTIKDNTASHLYTFPYFVFHTGTTFTLYTGTGTDTNTELYWGKTSQAIWNNDGDTLYLRNTNGELVLTKSYEGY